VAAGGSGVQAGRRLCSCTAGGGIEPKVADCSKCALDCVLVCWCATVLTAMHSAVQAHVCERIQRHHVSAVLAGQEPVKGCSSLWAQALADAACRLLRCVLTHLTAVTLPLIVLPAG
jgi:hypothetical protein